VNNKTLGYFFGSMVAVIIFTAGAFGAGWVAPTLLERAGMDLALPTIPLPGVGTFAPRTATLAAPQPQNDTDLALFWEAMALLDEHYYGQEELPQGDDVTYSAIEGLILSTGDPHSGFLSPEDAAEFSADLSGEFEGIGARVDVNEEGLVIVAPFPGTPASEAGLLPGDLVLEIDGVPTQGMTLEEGVSLVRGERGSTVTLLVRRDGQADLMTFEIVRDTIVVPMVTSRLIEEEGAPTIGYVQLAEFSANASGQFEDALREVQNEGAEYLIIDMRFNPGGLLTTAVDVTSQFIDTGNILTERMANGSMVEHPARRGGVALDIPIVVLVNGGSASASEIFAGAIKDTGRGTLIGETAFGKGSVQRLHTLSDESLLRITVARWFTPNGEAIHEIGIQPDVVVAIDPATLEPGEDPQLDAAVEYIREQMAAN
jgi:carboxyl-terminal processing protease